MKRFLAIVLCGCISFGISGCGLGANNGESSTVSTTTDDEATDKTTSSDAYVTAVRVMKNNIRSHFTSNPSIEISNEKVEEKNYADSVVKRDSEGNAIELPKSEQTAFSKYEMEIVDKECYYVTIKGNAAGYVDDYNDEYKKMTFTFTVYIDKNEGFQYEADLDYDWKY